jgi:hypothetical protein
MRQVEWSISAGDYCKEEISAGRRNTSTSPSCILIIEFCIVEGLEMISKDEYKYLVKGLDYYRIFSATTIRVLHLTSIPTTTLALYSCGTLLCPFYPKTTMAPSAISMDPVSQLESESAFIIEAAKMDVKSNPHYEVKPALVPITTELQYDGSTGPSSATDGFIDTPTNGLAVVEPSSATDGFTVVEPSSVVDGFTDAPAVGSTVIPSASEPEGFTDIPAAAPAAVDAPSETDGFVETQPEEAAAVEAAPAEAAAVEAAPVKAAPVEAAPIEAAPVEAAPVETAPVEAAPAVDDAMDVTPAAPAVVEEHPSVTEEVKETAPVELAVKEVSSATEPAAAAPPASLAVKEVPAAQSNKWLSLGQIIPSVQEPMSGAKKLRKMIFETNELIICPGVYDGLSARTAIEVGFNAMYMVRNRIPSDHHPRCPHAMPAFS